MILVKHEVVVLLVDAVVGQVLELVVLVHVAAVTLRSKPSQSLLEHIDLQRFIASDKHVDSQVKLVTVDKQGIGDVP